MNGKDRRVRICILSMQRVPNFGSVLQSYSLKKILTEMGHDVSFLDIEPREHENTLIQGHTEDFSAECDRGGFLAKIRKIDRYAWNRLRIKKASARQNEVFDRFVTDTLGVADPCEQYDLCIIGSDEVFNCASGSRWGFTTQLFGDVKNASNVVTYAASCGATTLAQLPQSAIAAIRNALNCISHFSVRDDNTDQFVKALTDKDVLRHADPVIIGNFDEEIAKCDISDKVPSRYCIVYSYYNRIHDPAEISAIQAFCRKYSLEIVSVGAPQMWIKNHLVLTPFEALAAFKNAAFVITDTFHGTIFSVKYAKRFVTITRPSNANKMKSLIKDLGIEKHYAKDMSDPERAYTQDKDQAHIDAFSLQEREKAIQYLTQITQ